MKKIKSIILLAPLAVCLSCEKIIEPKDLPEQDPRIVVNCLLNSDQNISADVSASKSIISGKDYKLLNNAVCEVYEDGAYIQNLVFTSNGHYFGSLIPKANKKYTLKVAASGYESATATTTMPDNTVIKPVERVDTVNFKYRLDRIGQSGDFYITGETKYKFRIVDDATLENFYSIVPSVFLLDSLNQPINYSITPTVLYYNGSNGLGGGPEYHDSSLDLEDKKIVNGNEIQGTIGIQFHLNQGSGSSLKPPIKRIVIYFEFQSVNEDYYKYKKTLLNQANMGISLFAEPVQVYNNIEQGMGILGGLSSTTIPVYNAAVD